MQQQEEYLTSTEAKQYLGVSEYKMARLLESGEIAWQQDPFKKHAKLIKKSDLDAWLAKAPRRPKKHHSPDVEDIKDLAA
jgi:excisionase family DNA binding protein